MDSGQTRIVKLTGLPEVLREVGGSGRVVDLTRRQATATTTRTVERHQRSKQSLFSSPPKAARTQTRNSELQHHNQQDNYFYNNQHHHQQQQHNQLRQHHHQRHIPQQQPLLHPPTSNHRTVGRSCTPNILHPSQLRYKSPPQQTTQRRAASSSPGPISDPYIIERVNNIDSGLTNLSKQFEQFFKIFQEQTISPSISSIPQQNIRPTPPPPHPAPLARQAKPRREPRVAPARIEEDDRLADMSIASREFLVSAISRI